MESEIDKLMREIEASMCNIVDDIGTYISQKDFEVIKSALNEHTKTSRLYYELIMNVGNAYPGETRHQTALRYIKNAERLDGTPEQGCVND